MSRSLPLGFDAAERAGNLHPAVEVTGSSRYLGRPVLSSGGSADDGLATAYAALAVRSGVLIQLKSRSTSVECQRRDASTLAITAAWALVASTVGADGPVALTQSGSTVFSAYVYDGTRARYTTSGDGGATWTLPAALHTAAVGNTVGSVMASPNGLLVVEERVPGANAVLYCYEWTGAAWSSFHSFDAGGPTCYGGGIDDESGAYLVYAVDIVEATAYGLGVARETRVYDLAGLAAMGTLHRGAEDGVRWREPRPVYVNGRTYLAVVVMVPRGTGDASDRVVLFPWSVAQVGGFHGVGPPRAVYAVEDAEAPAAAYGSSALFVMAGSYVQRLTEATSSSTASVGRLDLRYEPEGERLDVVGPGSLATSTQQLRCRLGLSGSYVDMGLFWVGSRVSSSREGWAVAAYGLWGVLRREVQQQSAELRQMSGDPMTPGEVLELVFDGLGFSYSEAAGLSSALHPATAAERLTWTMRYGQPLAELVRSVLRWAGCELVPGVAADGVTPTVLVMQPGSRLGASPVANPSFGATGDHPLLECVSIEPEIVTDVTVFPGGWDHQLTLASSVDRQLVLDASGAYGVTSNIAPATRALARALAGAAAGRLRLRPALEVEIWDTVAVTDTTAGLAAARRVVRAVSVVAGGGRWEMEILLGLE